MPSAYQRENLEAMLGLFLESQGHPLPQHSQSKSASALSRFLNGQHAKLFVQLALMYSRRFCTKLQRDVFGQATLLGVYRWLVLSLIAFILAHWAYLSIATTVKPNWGQAAQIAFQACFPQLLLLLILLYLERIRPFTLSHGIDIQFFRCKI